MRKKYFVLVIKALILNVSIAFLGILILHVDYRIVSIVNQIVLIIFMVYELNKINQNLY